MHAGSYYHHTIDYYLHQVLPVLKSEAFDCVILENRPGYALQLQGVTKARLVYHLGNDFLNSTTPAAAEIYSAAAGIVTVSDFIKSRVQTCHPADTKCVTVHNGIDLTPFSRPPQVTRASLGYDDDDFILAFSGRLIPEKGILELVEAMNLLRQESRIKLLVMGASFYDNTTDDTPFIAELKARSRDLGDRIRFTGYVQHDRMPDYLRLSDVAVIPSTWEEPFGLTVVEGMAAGLPVIVSDRGGIPEIVTPHNAIVVPLAADFPRQLSQTILSLFRNPEARQRMGSHSLQLAARFSKDIYAQSFFSAIDSFCGA